MVTKNNKEIHNIVGFYDGYTAYYEGWMSYFSDSMGKIQENGKYGYIDVNGNKRISCIYDEAVEFKNGYARARKDQLRIALLRFIAFYSVPL